MAGAKNFDLQTEIDLSLIKADWLEYKKIGFRSKHSMNPELDSILKLSFNDHIIFVKAGSKSIIDRSEYTFEAEMNSYNLRGNWIANDNSEFVFTVDTVLFDGNNVAVRGRVRPEVNDVDFKIDVDGQNKIVLVSNAKTMKVEVVDVFHVSKSFKFNYAFEQETGGLVRSVKGLQKKSYLT